MGIRSRTNAAADLLFPDVVELGLLAHAVEVVDADPQEVAGPTSPLPARLEGEAAAEVVDLPQVTGEGEEGHAARRSWAGRAEVGAKLEFPRLGRAERVERPVGLRIQTQAGIWIEGQPRDQRIARIVDPLKIGMRQEVQVCDVRTIMAITELPFPRAATRGQRNAKRIVVADEVSRAVEAWKGRAFDIGLPTFGPEIVFRAEADDAQTGAQRAVPNRAQTLNVLKASPSAAHARRPGRSCTTVPRARSATTIAHCR